MFSKLCQIVIYVFQVLMAMGLNIQGWQTAQFIIISTLIFRI
jgi:hypothetical protein